MSGVYGGVQRLIKDICTSPVPFVHRASHNLNLVINDVIGEIFKNENFFTKIYKMFLIFSINH